MKKQRREVSRNVGGEDLEDFKVLLGQLARSYTEAELRQLQTEMNAMAEVLLDYYQK